MSEIKITHNNYFSVGLISGLNLCPHIACHCVYYLFVLVLTHEYSDLYKAKSIICYLYSICFKTYIRNIEMVQWLSALANHQKIQVQFPTTTWKFTNLYNSNLVQRFWHHFFFLLSWAQTCMQAKPTSCKIIKKQII